MSALYIAVRDELHTQPPFTFADNTVALAETNGLLDCFCEGLCKILRRDCFTAETMLGALEEGFCLSYYTTNVV